MAEYTVAHLVAYAQTLKIKDRGIFVARALNTADEISLSTPTILDNTQLLLILHHDMRQKLAFEVFMNENTPSKVLDVNSLVNCLKTPEGEAAEVLQAFVEGRADDFTKTLRQLALEAGVFIAERVRFVA